MTGAGWLACLGAVGEFEPPPVTAITVPAAATANSASTAPIQLRRRVRDRTSVGAGQPAVAAPVGANRLVVSPWDLIRRTTPTAPLPSTVARASPRALASLKRSPGSSRRQRS